MAEKARRVNKVERYGAEAVVDAALRGGGTLQKGKEAFEKATGETISIHTLGRYRKDVLVDAAGKARQTEMLVERLVEREGVTYEDCDPGEATADLARRMLLTRAVEAVAGIPPGDMAALTPDKLAQMISRLEYTRISGERLRLQHDRAFTAAKEAIFTQLEDEMREHPDLLKKVAAVAEEAYEATLAKAEGKKSV